MNRRAQALKDRSNNENMSAWPKPHSKYFSAAARHYPHVRCDSSSFDPPPVLDIIKPNRATCQQNDPRLPHDRSEKPSYSQALTLKPSSLPPPFTVFDQSATKTKESRHEQVIPRVMSDVRESMEEASCLGNSVLDDSIDDGFIKPRFLFYGEPVEGEQREKKTSMNFKAAVLTKPPKVKPHQTLTSLSQPAPTLAPSFTVLTPLPARIKPRSLKMIQEETMAQNEATNAQEDAPAAAAAAAVTVRRVRFDDQESSIAPAFASQAVVAKLWAEFNNKIVLGSVIPVTGLQTLAGYVDLICNSVASKTPEGADRAAYILLYMLSAPGFKPDAKCYERVLAGYSRDGNTSMALEIMTLMRALYEDGFQSAKPKTYLLTTFAYTWSQCSNPTGIEKCEHVLSLYDKNGKPSSLKPNTSTYNALLRGWAKSGREGK